MDRPRGVRSDGAAREGFVLVSVLVVMALMAGIVGAASLGAHGAADTARLAVDRLAVDALTEAGIALAAHQLYAQSRAPEEIDGQQVRFDAGTVRLSVAPQTGLIDINSAAPELLAGLWRATGREGLSPESFAARVVDWRDGDDEVSPDGAEVDAYASGGLGVAPRDGPFRRPAELGFVLGVTAADVAALRAFVTVFNPDGTIDPLIASPTVLSALPGVGRATVEQILALRSEPREQVAGEIEALLSDVRGIVSTAPARSHRVQIEVVRPGIARTVSTVVIARGVRPDVLYHVLSSDP